MHLRPPYRPAGDRVYQAIKARLIAYEFPQGRRIYLEPIAESLGVSTTPVREALNRLAERHLVIKGENKGFYAMTLTETRIRGYYEVTRNLLVAGLKNLPASAESEMRHHELTSQTLTRLNRRVLTDAGKLATYTGEVFNAIATISKNDATQHAVGIANDHLYLVRTIEFRHIGNPQAELKGLCELLLSAHRLKLIGALNDYHEQRLALVSRILEDIGL